MRSTAQLRSVKSGRYLKVFPDIHNQESRMAPVADYRHEGSLEEHAGEIPVSITIVELPSEVAQTAGGKEMRLKVSHHFRVAPGPALNQALLGVHASTRYVF
jgi:hypothetical protein